MLVSTRKPMVLSSLAAMSAVVPPRGNFTKLLPTSTGMARWARKRTTRSSSSGVVDVYTWIFVRWVGDGLALVIGLIGDFQHDFAHMG